MASFYDLTVIGGGPGGYTAAIAAARRGWKVALIEADRPGGTCLNRGCIPTKALLYSAELFDQLRRKGEELGLRVEGLGYDLEAMNRRRDQVVEQMAGGVEALLRANHVEIFHGLGTVLGPGAVEVTADGRKAPLQSRHILLATGARPATLPLEGMNLPGVITSDELLTGPTQDTGSLVIIGGGVIGMEFACLFAALGKAVTILEAADRILPGLDREISRSLTMILKKQGVVLHTGCVLEKITAQGKDLCCRFTGKAGEGQAVARRVLVAVGRRANTDELFAPDSAPAMERGILVNNRFETSLPGLYAIGDVISGGIQLAHAAAAQAKNAVAAMAGEAGPVNLDLVPACVYTSPEIASVGITADEAKARGLDVVVGKYTMTGNGKTVIESQERSFMKLVFDKQSQVLLGAQLMCARASDIISEMTLAMAHRLTAADLAAVIRPHPTFSEAVTEAAEDPLGLSIHMLPRSVGR